MRKRTAVKAQLQRVLAGSKHDRADDSEPGADSSTRKSKVASTPTPTPASIIHRTDSIHQPRGINHGQGQAHEAARFQSFRHSRKPARLTRDAAWTQRAPPKSAMCFADFGEQCGVVKKGSTGFQAND